MTEVILSARAVEKSFGRTQALRGVSLELTRGEVLAVIVTAALTRVAIRIAIRAVAPRLPSRWAS